MPWCTGTWVPGPGNGHPGSCVPPTLPIQTVLPQLCALLVWGPGLKIGTASFPGLRRPSGGGSGLGRGNQLETGAQWSRQRRLMPEAVGELRMRMALQTFSPP